MTIGSTVEGRETFGGRGRAAGDGGKEEDWAPKMGP